MEVRVADEAGFCFGVKRAVDAVYEKLDSGRPIYTYGPIVHNEEVVNALKGKGVKVIENEEALEQISPEKDAIIIIRAHGISRALSEKISQKGFEIVDATCPFVKKIHNLARKEETEGRFILLAGDPKHPEIQGIRGWCSKETIVFETPEEADRFVPDEDKKYTLLAQTTYQVKKFQEIVAIFQKKGYNINVVSTICNATEERQRSAEKLAAEADAMIVIGSSNSSNTRKLYEICRNHCERTYYIQTLDDLHLDLPKSVVLVGITAGASTPQNIIEEVQKYVRGTYF